MAMSAISSEKKAVGILWSIDARDARVRAKAVLPTLGRAPMTMNSLGWKPLVPLREAVAMTVASYLDSGEEQKRG